MPKANQAQKPFYRFWRRAMEPWDGPALFAYSDGRAVGARLDRNGFRPCRWAKTHEHFLLSSEAGSFEVPDSEIIAKGSLSGGESVKVHLASGEVHLKDASELRENARMRKKTDAADRIAKWLNSRLDERFVLTEKGSG